MCDSEAVWTCDGVKDAWTILSREVSISLEKLFSNVAADLLTFDEVMCGIFGKLESLWISGIGINDIITITGYNMEIVARMNESDGDETLFREEFKVMWIEYHSSFNKSLLEFLVRGENIANMTNNKNCEKKGAKKRKRRIIK